MQRNFDIIIIGGGLIGSSIAFHLSQKLKSKNESAKIALIDVDLEGKYSSSELNAGGARAEWWHDINIELSKSTLGFLATHPDEFGFRQKGYLWLFDQQGWQGYEQHKSKLNGHQLNLEEITPKEITQRVDFIDRTDDLVGAIFSPKDGIFNPNLLKQYYRTQAKVAGVTFIDGLEVYDIHKETQSASKSIEILCHQICHGNQKPQHQDVLDILTHQKSKQGFSKTSLSCEVLVNAAGAWAAELALKYDHQVECSPLRRQMSLFNCKEIDLQNYGMIVDSSGLYFHAESDHILAGYATPQERTGFNFKYDGEPFFESEIWPKLLNRMSRAEALKHLSGWAGLYSVTPDRSGVMGQVDDKYKIYEAHSFTGRGAMQSHGVGLAMSELIIEKKYMTIDASSLHPNRFRSAHGKLLYEGMHI